MNRKNPTAENLFRPEAPSLEPNARAAMLLAAAVAPALVIAMIVPAAAVLPVLSIIAVLAGLGIAAAAWHSRAPWRGGALSAWDVAGALLFVGFAAGMLSDPMHLIALFEAGPLAR